ncbi:hypothetical protein AE618_06725 [Bosea vaviloviae]|uniref:Uncharacterized protein n=1 Tax=Bosea vaviloviae TaxID=1526658 RepID=A0A0N1N1M3_9HYPH|nr:hypothetical protein AE618_06725 [Bosea vaviloviae]
MSAGLLQQVRHTIREKIVAIRTSPVARTTFLAALTDGFNAVAGLVYVIVSTGLLYRYLGPAKFGVWATVFSLTAALAFMDFGLGNAAIGALARAKRRGSATLVRTVLIALMIASIGSGLLILVLSLTALHFGSVDALFGFKPSEISAELSAFIMTFAVLLAASFPINAMGQAMRGLQKAWIFNCSRMTGYIAATFGVWLGQSMSASLMTLLLLSFGLQLLCNAIVGCGVLIWQTRHAGQLRLSRIRRFIGRMLSTGGSYVLFNLARTFGWLLDYVLVIRLIGPEAAAGLAIIQRMYQVVTIGYSILSSALWPVYAYLISGHEWRRLRTLFLAGFSATVGYAVLASMLLFTFREEIAQVWLHNSVLSLTTAYGLFAIWYCVEAAGSSFSVLLNAKGIVTRQATAAVVFASVSFALKLWFVPLYGLTGLVSSTLAGYAVGFVTLLLLIRKIPLFRGR